MNHVIISLNKKVILSAVLTALGCFAFTARTADKENPGKAKMSVWTGIVETGVVAIGGETTGVILSTGGGDRYELDLGKKRDSTDKSKGKSVTVQGTLEIRPGVEGAERRIILVKSIKEARANSQN